MTDLSRILTGLFTATILTIPCAAQTTIGYVLESRGVWVLNGAEEVRRGRPLPASGSIRRRSSSNEDYITIADTGMRLIPTASRNCANEDCSRAIVLPARTVSRSFLRRGYDALMAVLFRSSESSDLNINRGGRLADGVVKIEEGKADLAAVITVEGQQYIRWRVVTVGKAGEWGRPVELGKNAAVSGLKAGLYEVNLMRSNGGGFESLDSAWLLAVSPSAYPKTAAAFNEAVDLTDQWADNVKPVTKRLFLRASLEELWRTPPK